MNVRRAARLTDENIKNRSALIFTFFHVDDDGVVSIDQLAEPITKLDSLVGLAV